MWELGIGNWELEKCLSPLRRTGVSPVLRRSRLLARITMSFEVIWGEASQYGGYRSAAEIVSGMLSPLRLNR